MLNFTIFKAPHLLWINLITDCFPALALGMEKPEKDIMHRKPRPSKEGIFADGLGFAVAYQGLLVTCITLASYFIGRDVLYDLHAAEGALHYSAADLGTSMAFLTLSMCEIFHSFNMRSLHGSIFRMKHGNPWLWGAAALSLLATTLVIEVPFLAKAFDFATLNLREYLIAIGLALSIIPIVEITKWVYRLWMKKKKKVEC